MFAGRALDPGGTSYWTRSMMRNKKCVTVNLREQRGRELARELALLAPDETVILLHPPLPLVGVSIVMERERQQNDSLVMR